MGYFSSDRLEDQIALYAIYIPFIRCELQQFVRVWNNHKIRAQRNRPNVISGKPFMLYNYPKQPAKDWGVNFDEELHKLMYDYTEGFDIEPYLTPEVDVWCNSYLDDRGFNVLTAHLKGESKREKPFLAEYLGLRTAIRVHILSGVSPRFSLLKTPTQVRGKYTELAQKALEEDHFGIHEVELPQDSYIGGEEEEQGGEGAA